MIPCPRIKRKQCVIWELCALAVLVFVAVFTVVNEVYDFSTKKDIIISIGASFGILWSIWVVQTFRAIMLWWIQMQDKMNQALAMLEDAKRDLDSIRKETKPK